MAKQRLVSGIQPSGRLHLGNYLGALRNFVELQNSGDYECFFFIADYHSLTSGPDPDELNDSIIDLAASFIALGLVDKSIIFQQSEIPEHNNLAYILSTLASYGRAQRMTQFKEKSQKQQDNINVGLFYYPILMASDILLYDAKLVPVGDDQIQHLELTRDLARKFNNRYGDIFTVPEPLTTETPRVMSLDNPENKMSKSSLKGCVLLDDSPEDIKSKVSSAVTDSDNEVRFDLENKKAVSNLILIYSSLSGKSKEEIEKEFEGKGYAEFKESLAEVIIDHFKEYRQKKDSLLNDKKKIKKVLSKGNKKADKISGKKLKEVREKVGLSIK